MRADRQGLIRLIHVAKRDLQLDDDTYRAILQRVAGKGSSSDLTVSELEKVLEHMKRSGFKVRSKGKAPRTAKPAKAKPSRPLAQDAESRKVRALWLFLHQLDVVKNPSEEALAAYVKRIAGVDALQWINGEQAERLIETMKKWAMRFLPARVKSLAERAAEEINAGRIVLTPEELAGLRGCIGTAQERQTYDPMYWAWESLTKVLKEGGIEA